MRIERLFRAVINKIPYFLTLVKEKTGIYGKFIWRKFMKAHENLFPFQNYFALYLIEGSIQLFLFSTDIPVPNPQSNYSFFVRQDSLK